MGQEALISPAAPLKAQAAPQQELVACELCGKTFPRAPGGQTACPDCLAVPSPPPVKAEPPPRPAPVEAEPPPRPLTTEELGSPERAETVFKLLNTPFHLLVIGGGVVGAGIARDAALRGLSVALVDQYDFAAGASGRTSRLLHGGLRYLKRYEFGLVGEASREKRILSRIAPHLVQPLPFIFPSYRGSGWPMWQLRLGVKVYDFLCGREGNLGASQSLPPPEVQKLLPALETRELAGAVRYFDALTSDARLTLDTLRSAARAGAVVCNYLRLDDAERGPKGWRCVFREMETGLELEAGAVCIVSAVGPWLNLLPYSRMRLRLSKGSHLVIDKERLPLPGAVVATEGSRILFAIPWGERVILGTTEEPFALPGLDSLLPDLPREARPSVATGESKPKGRTRRLMTREELEEELAIARAYRPDNPLGDVVANAHATPKEAEEILKVFNRLFPKARLALKDVRASWAGVRSLLDLPSGGASEDLPRRHEIREPVEGWLEIAGGKLTSYRHMAEDLVDRVVAYLVRNLVNAQEFRNKLKPCRTSLDPLLPKEEVDGRSGVLPPPVSKEAVEHYAKQEWALHLDDVMLRRAGWHYYHPDPEAAAREVLGWMAELRGWDETRRAKELERYHQAIDPPLAVPGSEPPETVASDKAQAAKEEPKTVEKEPETIPPPTPEEKTKTDSEAKKPDPPPPPTAEEKAKTDSEAKKPDPPPPPTAEEKAKTDSEAKEGK